MMRRLSLLLTALLLVACGGQPGATPAALQNEPTPVPTPVPMPTAAPTEQITFQVGETLTLPDGQTVTIHAIEPVPNPKNAEVMSSLAESLVIGADVEWCAGPNPEGGSVEATGFPFGLILADNTRGNTSLGEKEPGFYNATLRANACNRGWVTLTAPKDATPRAIEFQGYEWVIPDQKAP